MPRWDGRQHKQDVLGYELVVGRLDHGQLVWLMTLPYGHSVYRSGGREAKPGQYGAREINGKRYVCVPRAVACDICKIAYER